MKLLVGLGNPGPEYSKTRHNVGFWVLDRLASQQGVKINRPFFRAHTGQCFMGRVKLVLAKPQTYMNASGQSVAALLNWYKLSPADLLVVHDDLDLPPGSMRIRPRGGTGGHRGMASIVERLGGRDFPRLRIGIGKPGPNQGDVTSWVLGKFAPEDLQQVEQVIERAVDALQCFVTQGINQAMNKYNG